LIDGNIWNTQPFSCKNWNIISGHSIKGSIMVNQVLTIKQIAEYLQVNEKTIYTLVREGDLPAFKVRGQWRFKKEDIENWIEENKESLKNLISNTETNEKGDQS